MDDMFGGLIRRCPSILHTKDGTVQCIGKAPASGKSHTHVGRTDAGLRITWTDADAKESKEQYLWEETDETFYGWRCWRITKGMFLQSVTSETTWTEPVLRANGRPYVRELGEYGRMEREDVDYGIYCYKTPKLLYEHLGVAITSDGAGGTYGRFPGIGCIELSGHVVEHTKGYRAETATFVKIWIVMHDPMEKFFKQSAVREMEERYQCDVDLIEAEQVRGWADFFNEEEL